MEKISSQTAKALLKQAGATIRTLVEEKAALQEKVASHERGNRIRKIAQEMEQKHLQDELDFEQKVAALGNVPNLDTYEQAVKLASPQGLSLGNPGELPGGTDSEGALNTFIMSGETPEN